MNTPQKVLKSITKTLSEEIDYSEVTDADFQEIVRGIQEAELALHKIMEKSGKAAVNQRFDLFVDIANGN
ncbi:MAG: hypothetical protein H9W81_06080 [Enterococcus sp.]|nr:hypothetical protein [Enterococcus sp.]